MGTNRKMFVLRATTVAVQGALIAMATMAATRAADEPSVAELTTPTNKIEVAAKYIPSDSAKFGEYNGLSLKGGYPDVNFDLRGGGAYDSSDTTRWRVVGTNLGLDTRNVQAEYGEQGRFRINFGYDELIHNRSDSFKTPYNGVGSNNLTLPSNWTAPLYQTGAGMGGTAAAQAYPAPSVSFFGLAATSYNSPLVQNSIYLCKTSAGVPVSGSGCAANPAYGGAFTTTGIPGVLNGAKTLANTQMLANNLADLNDFHTERLSIQRTKYDLNLGFDIDRQWDVKAGWRHENKEGLQIKGAVTGANGPAGTAVGGEISQLFPQLIKQDTDQYNASINYKLDKTFFTVAYYGSIFKQNNPSMTLANPVGTSTYNGVANAIYGAQTSTITSDPSNQMHQLNFTLGHALRDKTNLVMDGSYSRNTQNASYILSPEVFGTATGAFPAGVFPVAKNGSYVPESSLHGVVINKSFDLKLTDKSIDKLRLAAAYKYDERDNQTPIDTYMYADGSGPGSKLTTNAAGTTGLSALNGANILGVPTGTKIYGVNIYDNRPYSRKVNQVNLDADYEINKRNSIKVGYDWQQIERYCNNSWIDCAFADKSKEDTYRAEYRFKATEDLDGRLAYDYSTRKVNTNVNAWMALEPGLGATNIATLVAQGWTGSVLQFMQKYGLGANGLPIPSNGSTVATGGTNPIPAAIAASQQLTNIYNLLFGGAQNLGPGLGSGNGVLNKAYYGSINTTQDIHVLAPYTMDNRNRNKIRGSVNWQANEQWSYQLGGSYVHDEYPDSSYGLNNSNNWGLNLDAMYQASEDFSIGGYYSYEDMQQKTSGSSAANGTLNAVNPAAAGSGVAYTTATGATGFNTTIQGGCIAQDAVPFAGATQYQVYQANQKTDACSRWSTDMRDKTDTVGINFSKKHFLDPKFDLVGAFDFSHSVSSNHVGGGWYQSNPLAAYVAGQPALIFINGSDLPDITSKVFRLRLNGTYRIDKASSIRVGYTFARLETNDYTYSTASPTSNGSTTTSGVVPTFEQSPHYNLNIVSVSYVYNF